MKIYCATSNAGKLREFQLALQGHVDVEAVPGLSGIAPPEETGATFEANAIAKALYYSRCCDQPVFADDSGLVVDALGGAPGVWSARYAGPEGGDDANNRLLLSRMRGMTNRAARFVCVIALARRCELLGTFRGEVDGTLAEEPRGAGCFGYDPLFYYPPFGCTFGEAPLADKMRVSHRSRALAQLREWLRQPR
ncbi:MAG: RdgB/HAM1 family non-canonical purine NTP pyrophosphatase [Bryobacteraceae bacterium]